MPPFDLQSILTTASTAGPQARFRLADNGQLVTKGTSLKGRAVAWLQEVFGGGARANQKFTEAFIGLVRAKYDDRVGDTVGQLLDDRLREGKPLCKRHVEQANRMAKETLATQLTDLGVGTHARDMIQDLVERGALSPAGANALLRQGSPDRARLEAAIKQAVLDAAPQDGQLLDLPMALAATNRAVVETARLMVPAQNEALAARLADLGDDTRSTHARDMIQDRGDLPAVAGALLRPGSPDRVQLEAGIKKAVLAAARQNEGRPLDEPTALEATQRAVDESVHRIQARIQAQADAEKLIRPGEDDGPHPRVLEVANGFLNDFGIALPDDGALADKMTDQWRTGAEGRIAQVLQNNPATSQDQLDAGLVTVTRPLLIAHVVEVLTAGGEQAEAALAKLRLPDNLDPDAEATRVLRGIAENLHAKGDDPKLSQARDAFDAAVIRACRERFLEQPGASRKVGELRKGRAFLGHGTGIGLCKPSQFAMISEAGKRELVQLIADLDEATVRAARADQRDLLDLLPHLDRATAARAEQHEPVQAVIDHDDEGAARAARGDLLPLIPGLDAATASRVADQGHDPAEALADLVRLRTHQIASEHECDAAAAIDILLKNHPDLVAHRDGVLAAMSERAKTLGRSADDARIDGVQALADLVTSRIDEIKSQYGCNEVQAINRLKETDPDLIDRMDRVLADGGNNLAPGAWLETRQQLAEMREKVKTLAGSRQASGTDLQRLTSAGLRAIAENLFESAVNTLGQAPGRFTVLGLGSTARGEASPYSDLEFAILLPGDHSEAERAYATELTKRVHDQIAALGEDGTDWKAEMGFHFDPLLNPITSPHLFLNTADRLVKNGFDSQEDTDWSRTTFVNAEWFYGSDVRRDDAGRRTEPNESWQALKDFHAKVAEHLQSRIPDDDPRVLSGEVKAGETEGQALGRWTIDLARNWASDAIKPDKPDVVDVKVLARLPMLLVQGLAVQHGLLRDDEGIAANNIDQRLTLLVEKGRISRQDADEIRDLQDKLSELRVRSHVKHGTQVDKVALTKEAEDREGLLHDPGVAKLVEDAQALLNRVDTIASNPPRPAPRARSGLDIAGEYVSLR
jgi:hypothetical protein